MVRNQIFALAALLISFASAAPEEFVLDAEGYRHGTYDRFRNPMVIYVDTDGAILFPVLDKLSKVGRADLEKTLSLLDRFKEKLELRVYIYPNAKWGDIQELVDWLSQQKINNLSYRKANLVKEIKE
jgi:biopolymer transport protein ExbD